MYSKIALITFYEGGDPALPGNALPGQPVYPSGGPIYGGGYPSHGLPGGGHVGNWVPGMEHPGGGPIYLPVFPFDPTDPGYGKPEGGRPDQELPGTGGRPSNELPDSPGHPSFQPIRPGARFMIKWVACIGLALVPDNSLPGHAEPKD